MLADVGKRWKGSINIANTDVAALSCLQAQRWRKLLAPTEANVVMKKAPLTPEQRVLRARLAAHVMHSRNDSREVTAPARAAFLAGFEQEVDPQGQLPVEERIRRAEQARRAHFTRLALASSRARATREARS